MQYHFQKEAERILIRISIMIAAVSQCHMLNMLNISISKIKGKTAAVFPQ